MAAAPRRQWFKPFARAGYASRGLVYAVIGLFALLAAFGSRENVGSRDALATLLGSPAGDVLPLALILGMISYMAWRFIQALFDTDGHGTGAKGLAVRGGLLASGLTYAVLALYTFGLWNGSSGGGTGEAITTFVTGIVGSRVVALVLTAIFAGVGIAHIVKAVRRGYIRHFVAPASAMRYIHPVARAGLAARGAVFLILAFLFFYRGLSAGGDGGSTPGIEDVLEFIQSFPAGWLLLGLMGLGLLAFAAYSFLEAAWRRINIEDADVA